MSAQSLARRVGFASLSVAYACGCAVLVFYGVRFWRLTCEGFGCTGLGIAWFAWCGAYVVVLVLGLPASLYGAMRRAVRFVLAVQATAGAGLLAYWAIH